MEDNFEQGKEWCLDLDIRGDGRDHSLEDIEKQSE
jgi:hypothetical protein